MRYALPQPVTRHAADDGMRVLAGSVPVRRGIAVVAVVGGALSVAGAAPALQHVPAPSDPADDPADDLAGVGLAADSKRVVDADDDDEDSDSSPAVLDTGSLAESVREANEEGRRLAAEDRASDDDADDSGESGSGESGSDESGSDESGSDESGSGGGAEATGAAAAPAGGTASEYPAELIDTNEWYLTLPTGKKGDPDTVDGDKLATYHSKFFALNESRDGMVFTANAGGVTTSGSKYPRSELREMEGEKKASWDGRKGTHTMEIDQAVTKTPNGKPDVICGQIHATSDDLMQIHLSGKTLTVKYADGKKKVVLDSDYKLGERFKTKIESSEGHVKVWHNGELKADLAINSSTSYFKAGAYVNANESKGADGASVGQVVIYKLDVQHS